MRRTLLFIILSVFVCQLHAQILPSEGSRLNYRLIGFSFPFKDNVDSFRVEIAKGICTTNDSFNKNIIKTVSSNKNRIITEVPFWGEDYTWRYIYTNTKSKNTFHHFSTLNSPKVDTNRIRLRILHTSEKHNDAYVLLDNNKVMYDMTGKPVWFLPDSLHKDLPVNDLKLSPSGTLTMLLGTQAFEISYSGIILWKAPNTGQVSGDSTEYYNHEFTKLTNGRYMVLGNARTYWRPPTSLKDNPIFNADTASRKLQMLFGTLMEYDKAGSLVWAWNSSNYFLESDINYCDPFNDHTDPHARDIVDTHVNAFYFDEKNKNIYTGYKIINRIVKLKYPEGNVNNVYGKIYKSGQFEGEDIFCGQHSICKSRNGNLILFDNHTCDKSVRSRVIILKEPDINNGVKIIWEYTCPFDDTETVQNVKGGNVVELADSSLFVCMGVAYSKLFIVTMDKNILWSAIPEVWSEAEKKWNVNSQYRSSIIQNKEDLGKMIWNNEEPVLNSIRHMSSP